MILLEELKCTEKELAEEFTADAVESFLVYLELKSKAEELRMREEEAKLRLRAHTPVSHPPRPSMPRR